MGARTINTGSNKEIYVRSYYVIQEPEIKINAKRGAPHRTSTRKSQHYLAIQLAVRSQI